MPYTVKICGKSHPACNECRPGYRGNKFTWTEEGRARHKVALSHPRSEETRSKQANSARRAHAEGRAYGWKITRSAHLQSAEHIFEQCKCAGWKHKPEALEKIATALANRFAGGGYFQKRTPLEKGLALLLGEAGLRYEEQVRFGRYVVDFWLPDIAVVFEADGIFWHQDREKEIKRDKYLLDRGAKSVIHLNDTELSPWVKRLQEQR